MVGRIRESVVLVLANAFTTRALDRALVLLQDTCTSELPDVGPPALRTSPSHAAIRAVDRPEPALQKGSLLDVNSRSHLHKWAKPCARRLYSPCKRIALWDGGIMGCLIACRNGAATGVSTALSVVVFADKG